MPVSKAVASVDGVITTLEAARVPVSDRAFHYGDAVFEALRTYRGEPDALDRHLERLEYSASRLGIAMPLSRADFADEVRAAVAALDVPERYVRIVLSRGDSPESFAPAAHGGSASARRVIVVRPLALPPPELHVRGLALLTEQALPSRLLAGAKPTAYLTNMLAVREANDRGADDALLVGLHGELLEGATSSVFVVRQGLVRTPPLSLGILPGITRERIFACAPSAGTDVRESLLTVHDAYRADEVFLTSSVRGIMPVTSLDGLRVGTGAPGPVTERLRAAYVRALSKP